MIPAYPYSEVIEETPLPKKRSVVWDILNWSATAIGLSVFNTMFHLEGYYYYTGNQKVPVWTFYIILALELICTFADFSFFYFTTPEDGPTND